MDGGAWQSRVHGIAESGMTERLRADGNVYVKYFLHCCHLNNEENTHL